MAKFLLHQNRAGDPIGVWRSPEEFYYPPEHQDRESYGREVVSYRGEGYPWEEFIDDLAFRFPGPRDQWDVYNADGTLELNEVYDEAVSNTTFGD